MHTPRFSVTGIHGTRVIIIAVYRLSRADASVAGIHDCAGIMIVTRRSIKRLMGTARCRITPVLSALVMVVTVYRSPGTGFLNTGVIRSAFVSVIAWGSVKHLVNASRYCITLVSGALVLVIAIHGRARAGPVFADILCCAGSPIVADYTVQRLMEASCLHITLILCTVVPVIAIQCLAGAETIVACVINGAGIPVVAYRPGQRLMCATDYRDTFVLGALVPVIAVYRLTRTHAIIAGVIYSADVIIITGEPVHLSQTRVEHRAGYLHHSEVRRHFLLHNYFCYLTVTCVPGYLKGVCAFRHEPHNETPGAVGHSCKGISRRVYPCVGNHTAGIALKGPFDLPSFQYVPGFRILRLSCGSSRTSRDHQDHADQN